ncbi:glycosyltransferase family A protein [Halobacteriovorax sp. RZ-3]|uniref:glycosyltransferase family 2 protein n=1 Tax=Halobacteriovorax sp. RZ-3 TaxID=3157720 RepID=UPI00371C50FB
MTLETFSFVILTFNHEKYIIELLESIKYQINTYKKPFNYKLIIADDSSRDNTIELINFWLTNNTDTFDEVEILSPESNQGTCINYTKSWEHISGKYFKVIAGDDLFSFNDIVESVQSKGDEDLLSGLPILLVNNELIDSNSTHFHMIATDVIYKGSIRKLLNGLSMISAPSFIYSKEIISNRRIFDFIRNFKLVEDFALLIGISKESKGTYRLKHQVDIYYRRTAGSAFIVKNNLFLEDKYDCYDELSKMESSLFKKILIKNRKFILGLKVRYISSVLNLNAYIYLLNLIFNCKKIYKEYMSLDLNIDKHRDYYKIINAISNNVIENFEKTKDN